MDYLSRGFKSVLGSQGDGNEGPSGSETVERLCDRISSATLLDDRRDAVRAVKSLSKKYRLDVGTKAMGLLMNVLQKDRSDAEICGLALEALINILSSEDSSEPLNGGISDADLAMQFTEIFLKEAENVTTLLALLEEYDFRVRWPTVKLLTILLTNRAIQIQQCILVSPLGVSRLMDLLSDTREVIRNDGLLLLIQLTKGNAAIQKIVAFENAFDKLLEIVSDEGYSDGGIVVEDCLLLMSNLFNASNINFFREGSYIQRLVPFFDFSEYTKESKNWNEQKVTNVLMMLNLVRCLVSPSNPPQSTQSSQKIIHSCNLLKLLCDILMTVGIPAEILTETVNTVAEIIRGNQTNQAFFSVVDAPYNPPKPAIVVLLMSMISDKQPFFLRCAVLYCFQCYLYKNPTGQARIISTLLPSSTEAANVTAGQLLCGGLFSPDGFSNWCAATALSHSLLGNKELKEQLLRVQLATGVDCQPVSLLQQCSNILSNGGSPTQTKAAILSLLCNWLSNCPVAVTHFLSNGAIIPFLLSCVEQPCETHETIIQGLSAMLIGVCIVYNESEAEAFTADSIKRLITTRLDPEHFLSKINNLSKVEAFTSAAKHTQIQETDESNVLFDHEFTKQFKKLEVSISRMFLEDEDGSEVKNQSEAVLQYKELIREQDEELSKTKKKCAELQEAYDKAQSQLEQQAIDMISLRNEVALYKNNQLTNSIAQNNQSTNGDAQDNELNSQISILNDQLKVKDENISHLQNELEMSRLSVNDSTTEKNTIITSLQVENMSLKKQVDELNSQTSSLLVDNSALKTELKKVQNSLSITQASLEVLTTNKQLNEDVATPNQMSRDEIVEYEELKLKVVQLERENEYLKISSKGNSESKILEAQLRADLAEKTSEYNQQKQDYEDLLVLLEDQDTRIKKLKSRLRELGENIADESTDEDDDDDIPNDVASENKNNVSPLHPNATAAKMFEGSDIDLT